MINPITILNGYPYDPFGTACSSFVQSQPPGPLTPDSESDNARKACVKIAIAKLSKAEFDELKLAFHLGEI